MAIQLIVAGLGPRGRDWVREVTASGRFRVGAYVDANETILRDAAAQLKIPAAECFTNLDAAMAQVACQAVIVATSPGSHRTICENALGRSVAVLVEKPFTLRLRDAIDVVRLAEKADVPLLVAQNYRYMRGFRGVKRVIADGLLGDVRMVSCQYFRPAHEMAASLRRLEHSILYGVSVHHLDALRYVLGKEVTNVSAESFSHSADAPHGASFRALLTFQDGARASYAATYESSGHEFFEGGQEFYARFVGERGTLHVFHRWLVLCGNGKLPRLVRRGKRETTEEQILLQQLEKAIADGSPPEVSGRDNLNTMAILEACVRSATEQRWINPQELLHEYV